MRPIGLKKTTEFEIYIGCNDPQIQGEVVSREELEDLVVSLYMNQETAMVVKNYVKSKIC